MPKTPILKSQRTPKDFRSPTIKTDRSQSPIGLEDSRSSFSDEEAAMLERLRLPVYGADDDAALRDILFTWWEQRPTGSQTSSSKPSTTSSSLSVTHQTQRPARNHRLHRRRD